MATNALPTRAWPPTRVVRVIGRVDTSTSPLHVATDAGRGYVKTLGNPEGPDALICEWIGTNLAAWLGLSTFDIAIVDYPEGLSFDLTKGCESLPGPAFVARAVKGRAWDGTEEDLAVLENPAAISGLVLLDMWTRNHDRYLQDGGSTRCMLRNVFFCAEGAKKGRHRLVAMDHSECFKRGAGLTSRGLFGMDAVQDARLYGLFPAFRAKVTRQATRSFLDRLDQFRERDFDAAASAIPAAWRLGHDTREAMKTFCVDRAKFLVSAAEKILEGPCRWQPLLPGTDLR